QAWRAETSSLGSDAPRRWRHHRIIQAQRRTARTAHQQQSHRPGRNCQSRRKLRLADHPGRRHSQHHSIDDFQAMNTLSELTQRVLRHRDERDWKQFHTPKELAISLIVEAGELLELMQWKTGAALDAALETRREQVRDELADCLHSILLLADYVKVDLAAALEEKLKKDALKYPVEKSRGRAEKYDEL